MGRNGNRTGDRTGTRAAHPRDGAALPRSGRAELDTHALMIADQLRRIADPYCGRNHRMRRVSTWKENESRTPLDFPRTAITRESGPEIRKGVRLAAE